MNAAKPVVLDVEQDQERKRKKRGAVIKFSLAGVALLGIGAAATSAAWTDDAWFSGGAGAFDTQGGIHLQAALDSGLYGDAHQGGTEIQITDLGTLLPGETHSYQLHVKNAGKTDVDVVSDLQATGALITQDGVTVTLGSLDKTTLAANETAVATLTVTAPAWDNSQIAVAQDTGQITVQFTGTAAK